VLSLNTSRIFALVLTLVLCGTSSAHAQSAAPIKIGDINSYSGMAPFTEPYRKGAELAVEEANAAGGAMGRPFQVIFRDDAVKPGDAIRHAEELLSSEKVVILAGGFTSSVALALSDFALQRKVPFVCGIASSDAIVWAKGNRFTFRTATSASMQAGMAAEAAAKLPAKRWATLAPNYEMGTSYVAAFKAKLSKLRPDVEWVGEQWPALSKIDPGPTIDALNAAHPEAIFNATFGTDLIRFVREGNTRGFFKDKAVVSPLAGQPEYLDPLKDETPEGWLVTGYPWQSINTPEHDRFRAAYEKKYNDYPRWDSVLGYVTYRAIVEAIRKAGSTDSDAIVDALSGLTIDTPVGSATYRASDHQSTLPYFVGKLAKKNGEGIMTEWRLVRGEEYLPSADEVLKLRPNGN
jgi:branched-chain amino acid transport system substrate-binding protein